MSMFGTIMAKIFHHGEATAAPTPSSSGPGLAPAPPAPSPSSATAATPGSASAASTPTQDIAPPSATTPASAPPTQAPVDVAAVLDGLAAKSSQRLDWKHSIVDIMKLLDLDSSLAARKTLAQELHFGGDMNDSAGMNIWLHKEVMQKLAANGGKVPAELQS